MTKGEMHDSAAGKEGGVRDVLAAFFNKSYSHTLPVEWENMPPLSPLPAAGWIRFRVEFDQIAPIGLKPSMLQQRGHLRFMVAVPIGHGMTRMDEVTMEITALFAGRTIGGIHLGDAVLESPFRQQGFHLRALDIGFSATAPGPAR